MADPSSIGEHILAALGGSVVSFVAAVRSAAKQFDKLKTTVAEHADKIAAHTADLRELDKKIVASAPASDEPYVRKTQIEGFKLTLSDDIRTMVQAKLDELKRSLRLEVDTFKDDLKDEVERKARDFDRQTNPGFNTVEDHRRRIEVLERLIERQREEHRQYVSAETFNNFTRDQNNQWNEMNRTLGQITGALKIKQR